MIKICFVDEDGRFGGPQVRMIETFQKIDKKKFKIQFLLPDNILIFKKKLKKINAKYSIIGLSVPSLHIKAILNYLIKFPLELIRLKKFFENGKFDIIQANGVPHFKTIIAAKLAKKKSVWIIEDTYSPKILVSIFKFVASLTDTKIVYISKKVFEFYIKDSNLNHKNLNEIMSSIDSSYFKRKNQYKDNKNLILTTVSSIIPVKNVELFIEVANTVISKFENIKFVFAGRPINTQREYYNKIQKKLFLLNDKIRKKIIFKGLVLDVKKLLNRADIFICTSSSEGGPMAVWEAMSMEIPVVTTKVGGTPQYIKNNYNGYLSNPGDEKSLSNNIIKLISDFKLRKKLGKQARKTVLKKLDSKLMTKRYEKLYEKIYRDIYQQ